MPKRRDSSPGRPIAGLVVTLLLGGLPAHAQSPAVPLAKIEGSQPVAGAQPIDLPTTLRLAGANNIDLALVREALVQAEAQNDAATLSFFPSISGGVGYSKHNGAIQDVSGNILDANKQLRSTIGGISSQVNLGDAIFQKLAANRLQSAAEYSVDAGRNVTLFTAASAYLDLVAAYANTKIAEEAVRISGDYENQINRAVSIGLANKSDALRVSVQTQSYQVALRQAREATAVASATLANILHVDPATQFAPTDETVPQITIVPLETTIDSLVSEAFGKRPEVKASAATIDAADWQKTQSIYGPLIPSVGAQALYGNINGGRLGIPSASGGTQDYGVMFNWKIGPGGLFDYSRMNYAESKLNQSKLNDAKLHADIGRQVVQSFQGVHSAFDQLQLTKKNMDLAEQSLALSQGRKEFGVATILEVIQAQKDLVQARAAYVRAVTAYAEGQYALAQAVGRISE
jgi:outer membrane protein TolC